MIYTLTERDLKSSSAILRVRGPDANSFLQGQFTQDVQGETKGRSYGLWLDHKGRVQADGHVLRQAASDFLVVSFSATAGQLRERLEAYLIADEVELADETALWSAILLWGDDAVRRIPPAAVLGFASRRAGTGSVQWLAPAAQLSAVSAELEKNSAIERDGRTAELERLRQGVPAVPADIGPRDLPNEGGLDEVAISYTKGCYLGQEVMARLKNLGQVRRRLHLVRGTGAPPAPGTALFQGERKAGEMRSAAADEGGFLAMAMLSLVNLEPGVPLGADPAAPGAIRILRRV
ncbi:MAG TPA: folate-binding protein [Lacunisphaera sp.]|nr:folate-binding protein [Lacunisphaera sp.]